MTDVSSQPLRKLIRLTNPMQLNLWTFCVVALCLTPPLALMGFGVAQAIETAASVALFSSVGVTVVGALVPQCGPGASLRLAGIGAPLGLALLGVVHGLLPVLPVGALVVAAIAAMPASPQATWRKLPLPSTAVSVGLVAAAWTTVALMATTLRVMVPNAREFSVYGDLQFHEAISRSIGAFGPWDSTILADQELKYHWLANAWADAIRVATDAGPFQGVAIAVPVVGGTICVLAAAAVAATLTSRTYAIVAASFVVGMVTFPLGNLDTAVPLVLAEISPTHTFSAGLALSMTALLLGASGANHVDARNLGAIGLVAGLLVLGRVPLATIALAGAVFITLYVGVVFHRWRSSVVTTAVVALSMVLVLAILVAGGSGNGFTLSVNSIAASSLGLFPYSGPGDSLLAVISVLSWCLWPVVASLGALSMRFGPVARMYLWMVVGSSLAAAAACIFLDQAGLSQITFAWGSMLLAAPLAAVTASIWVSTLSVRRRLAIIAAGATLGVVFSAAMMLGKEMPFAGAARWLVGLIPMAVLAYALGTWAARPRHDWARSRLSPLAALAIVAAAAAGVSGSLWNAVSLGSSVPLKTVQVEQLAAASWVEQNVPVDAIFSTNRQCGNIKSATEACSSDEFIVSALTGRRVIVEGVLFSDNPISPDGQRRLDASTEFSRDSLVQYGVDWLWLDNSVWPLPLPPECSTLEYENEMISIFRFGERCR